MSNPTNKTYRFRTFQELVDVVPAHRIPVCMEELASLLTVTTSTASVLYEMAKDLTGKDVPEADRRVLLPEVLEWIDDGKRDLQANFSTEDGDPLLQVKVNKSKAE